MEKAAKIRVNLESKEVEIEGSEKFVTQHVDKVDALFKSFQSSLRKKPGRKPGQKNSVEVDEDGSPIQTASAIKPKKAKKVKAAKTAKKLDPATAKRFGNFYLKLPKSAKDVDKVFAAGYFASENSNDKSFTTRDATRLLTSIGVNISNPSQAIKYNVSRGRFESPERSKYVLSEDADFYLKTLHRRAKRGR